MSSFAFLENLASPEVAKLLAGKNDLSVAIALADFPSIRKLEILNHFPSDRQTKISGIFRKLAPGQYPSLVSGLVKDLQTALANASNRAAPSQPVASAASANNSVKTVANPQVKKYLAATQKVQKNNSSTVSDSPATKNSPSSIKAKEESTASHNELSATLKRLIPQKLRKIMAEEGVIPMPAETPPAISTNKRELLKRQFSSHQERLTKTVSAATRAARAINQPSTPFVPTEYDKRQALRNEIAQARLLASRNETLKVDGAALAASILRETAASVRENIIAEVPEIYEALRKRMFVFADLEKSPPKTLAMVFSTVAPETAALALRFASNNLTERVRRALSLRRMQLIDDEIARAAKRTRLVDIENAQQKIIDLAVDLQHRGEVIIDLNTPDII